jgi:hypothetical protein
MEEMFSSPVVKGTIRFFMTQSRSNDGLPSDTPVVLTSETNGNTYVIVNFKPDLGQMVDMSDCLDLTHGFTLSLFLDQATILTLKKGIRVGLDRSEFKFLRKKSVTPPADTGIVPPTAV